MDLVSAPMPIRSFPAELADVTERCDFQTPAGRLDVADRRQTLFPPPVKLPLEDAPAANERGGIAEQAGKAPTKAWRICRSKRGPPPLRLPRKANRPLEHNMLVMPRTRKPKT